MAPPGRRKPALSSMFPFLLLLLLTTSASAASAVLGIDLGTEYIKAAIAKTGSPIEIVLTKDSRRKEAATLAFKPSRAQANDDEAFPERLYGADAIALSARYPGDVYPNLKTLLGVPSNHDLVTTYTNRYPGLSLQPISRADGGDTSTVGFKSQIVGAKREPFMVEELLAMELKNIKANAEAMVTQGVYVTDVVLTYPAFWTAEEKRAAEFAAELAGLRVLGMISDGLAVGLNYATSRTFDSISEGAKPEYHLIYDMGAGSTTATVVRFQGRTIKGVGKRNQTVQEVQVLGTGHDLALGGDHLNDLIVTDMIGQFVETPKAKKLGLGGTQVRSNAKAMARLWKDAERLRQVLSANTKSSTSFDGLYDEDLNFKYSLTREEFEHLARGVAGRVSASLSQALDSAGITMNDLNSVILHGGAVRTPFVQKGLEIGAGGSGKIKTNVNADEAAVMGAAFKAAAISPSFRVKEIRTSDISGSSFTLKWTSDGKERHQKLFTPTSHTGADKQVPIKTLEDVTFVFSENAGSVDLPVLEVAATNLTKSVAELKDKYGCAVTNISTTFNVRLSAFDGLPEVFSGTVSCKADSVKEGGVMDNVKGLFGFGKKGGDQEPLVDDLEDPTTETPIPISDPTSSGTMVSEASSTGPAPSSSSVSSSSASSASKSAKSAKATPSTIIIPLALKSTPLGLNTPPTTALPQIKQRLSQFDASDQNAMLRSEALNTLEAFTYRARDYLEDPAFIAVSSETARKDLGKQLAAASEWLYGEGTDAKLQDFKDKLKGLKAIVDPVLSRKSEGNKRDQAVKALNDSLENMSSMVQMVKGSIERAAQDAASSASSAASSVAESVTSAVSPSSSAADELEEDPYSSTNSAAQPSATDGAPFKPEYTEDDLSSLTKAYDSAKSWLDEKMALQSKLGPYDDPAVLVADLETKAKQLQATSTELIMKTIRKQEPPKKQKPKKPKSTKKPQSAKSMTVTASSESVVDSSTTTSPSAKITGKDEL